MLREILCLWKPYGNIRVELFTSLWGCVQVVGLRLSQKSIFGKLAIKSPRHKALTFNFIFLCASATSWQIKTFETVPWEITWHENLRRCPHTYLRALDLVCWELNAIGVGSMPNISALKQRPLMGWPPMLNIRCPGWSRFCPSVLAWDTAFQKELLSMPKHLTSLRSQIILMDSAKLPILPKETVIKAIRLGSYTSL